MKRRTHEHVIIELKVKGTARTAEDKTGVVRVNHISSYAIYKDVIIQHNTNPAGGQP